MSTPHSTVYVYNINGELREYSQYQYGWEEFLIEKFDLFRESEQKLAGERKDKTQFASDDVLAYVRQLEGQVAMLREALSKEKHKSARWNDFSWDGFHQQGKWTKVKDIEDMMRYFHSRLGAIRIAARDCGYAIGLHGSCQRDFDLIAIPWVDNPKDSNTLAHAIAMAACGISKDGNYTWESKPLGRIAVSIPICWPEWKSDAPSLGMIDLSVAPLDTLSTYDAFEKRVKVEALHEAANICYDLPTPEYLAETAAGSTWEVASCDCGDAISRYAAELKG